MLDNIDITKILFFDIETVPGAKDFSELDENWQYLWQRKADYLLKISKDDKEKLENNPDKKAKELALKQYKEDAAKKYNEAGIYAEFGKIICISVGFIYKDKDTEAYKVRTKSFANEDEKKLLQEFSHLMNTTYNRFDDIDIVELVDDKGNKKKLQLLKNYFCGHNIKEFDVPYICRRLLINGLKLPRMFDLAGKKSWEVPHLLDTMELWKFGDYKSSTSLNLLAATFGFPSPKEDMDGSQVARVYYEEKDLPRIAKYCEKDVIAVMRLLMKYKLMPDELEIS